MSTININGMDLDVVANAQMPLLWVLRDVLHLTGTKFGCGIARCGACTVHLDGAAVRSCALPLSAVTGRRITTIEGLSMGKLHPIQKAWIAHKVPQCGYCQPGMMMAAAALLDRHPHPTDEDINLAITNICRCGTYQRIRNAIKAAGTDVQS